MRKSKSPNLQKDAAAYLRKIAAEITREQGLILHKVRIDMPPEKRRDGITGKETTFSHRLCLTVECIVTSPEKAEELREL